MKLIISKSILKDTDVRKKNYEYLVKAKMEFETEEKEIIDELEIGLNYYIYNEKQIVSLENYGNPYKKDQHRIYPIGNDNATSICIYDFLDGVSYTTSTFNDIPGIIKTFIEIYAVIFNTINYYKDFEKELLIIDPTDYLDNK